MENDKFDLAQSDDWLDTEPTVGEWVVLIALAAVMFWLIQVVVR